MNSIPPAGVLRNLTGSALALHHCKHVLTVRKLTLMSSTNAIQGPSAQTLSQRSNVPSLHTSAGTHHSQSAPAITAVKVVPRVGDADDTGPLRPRFTSLPTHLDAITEK